MPADIWTLGFDTSAAHCAAALLRSGEVIGQTHEDMAKGQAERLMPFLQEMLAAAGIDWPDISVIAVGVGPGNFTGVRISVSAARGLALALGIPAVGVNTLEALALDQPRPLRVLLDARRGEVYTQLFHGDDEAPPEMAVMADIDVNGCHVTGTAVSPDDTGYCAPVQPLAVAIARIGAARALMSDAPRPAPLYLRGADAAPPSDPPPTTID